ncbi:MAG: hypothetical protein H6719_17965 [Sandaracinaceae bacterium]|nr:hypothetical protein [Sandaracinaceae bacterium]
MQRIFLLCALALFVATGCTSSVASPDDAGLPVCSGSSTPDVQPGWTCPSLGIPEPCTFCPQGDGGAVSTIYGGTCLCP